MAFTLPENPTITDIHILYKTTDTTVREVVDAFFARSEEKDASLNAVAEYTKDLAYNQADKCDELLSKAREDDSIEELFKMYPLLGIPFFVKAIIQVEGEQSHASSKILKGFTAAYSATPYVKAAEAKAVLLGSTYLDEFACGASGETSAYGATGNAYDTDRVPGGSSSGPVTVVASGQAVFSLGTDTGGSIRQPSAFSKVVGLKTNSRTCFPDMETMAMASSLDQVGPIANSVEDIATIIQIIAGKDQSDQTSRDSSDLISRMQGQSTADVKYTIGPAQRILYRWNPPAN
jgi:aspartyl-tRNA(Asn)/glutamyl-tRNA(Gln) amidotransferase subunit A